MTYEYRPHIAQNLDELVGSLYCMLGDAPKFVAHSDLLEGMNIDAEFAALNDGLEFLRPELGEELFQRFYKMTGEIKTCFEADPDDSNGEAMRGRHLIFEMEETLAELISSAGNDE
jgi:hypothetical protein